ncbi:VanZ family protein [Streptomyces marincola]|uniref:VanZ family protein n=1 Tax=Streptomyces marincola TaxID=2878388 RepID=UPI001CF5E702|nr:VanZ family protein [Streptomyces marincola]UCM86954.1 VanZ family protein [Streptomyces marincola]
MARVTLFRAGRRARAAAGDDRAPRESAPGHRGAGEAGSAPGAGRERGVPRPPALQRDTRRATLARALVLAAALVCMVAFAVALARVTLVPSPGSTGLVHTNLRPGHSIRTYLDQPERFDTLRQIGGNVLLGVLLPMLFPRVRGLLRVMAFTALLMVMVEVAQGSIVEGRAFDIDDVILNVTGALLGYLAVGRRLGRALHPRRRHWWHRWTGGRAARPARRRADA